MSKRDHHLFIIEPGVYRGADVDEVAATVDGLTQMGLYRLPYDRDVYIQIRADDIISCEGTGERSRPDPKCYVVFGPLGDGCTPDAMLVNERNGYRDSLLHGKTKDEATAACAMAQALLIVLLATRNVVKTTRTNKLAKLGIGKKNPRNRYAYTTTISMPRAEDMEDDAEHPPTGATRAPHLRRGHRRTQHYGPRNSFTKQIWIAPMFVNADPGFVSTRKAYNIVGPSKE